MSSDSDIRTDRVGEHLWVVSAPGERDLADVDELEAVFDGVLQEGSTLVIDLSDTTFIDSARDDRPEGEGGDVGDAVNPTERRRAHSLLATTALVRVTDC